MSHNEKKPRFTQQMRRAITVRGTFFMSKAKHDKNAFRETLKIEKRQQKIARHGRGRWKRKETSTYEVSI